MATENHLWRLTVARLILRNLDHATAIAEQAGYVSLLPKLLLARREAEQTIEDLTRPTGKAREEERRPTIQ